MPRMTETASGSPTAEPWSKVKEDRHGDIRIELFTRRRAGRSQFLAKVGLQKAGDLRISMIVTGRELRDVEDAVREHVVFYRIGRMKVTRQ